MTNKIKTKLATLSLFLAGYFFLAMTGALLCKEFPVAQKILTYSSITSITIAYVVKSILNRSEEDEENN